MIDTVSRPSGVKIRALEAVDKMQSVEPFITELNVLAYLATLEIHKSIVTRSRSLKNQNSHAVRMQRLGSPGFRKHAFADVSTLEILTSRADQSVQLMQIVNKPKAVSETNVSHCVIPSVVDIVQFVKLETTVPNASVHPHLLETHLYNVRKSLSE